MSNSATQSKKVGGPKNGGERQVPSAAIKALKHYPSQKQATKKRARKAARPTTYRSSLKPGTVLILLAGKYRGKRVVLLKTMEKGLLLVSGPFKINGVPLRRVNHKYVIATSTRLELPSMDLDKYTSTFFAKSKTEKAARGEADFFGDNENPTQKQIAQERIEAQKSVDSVLLPKIKAIPNMKEYLASSFSLSKGEYPHLMKF